MLVCERVIVEVVCDLMKIFDLENVFESWEILLV